MGVGLGAGSASSELGGEPATPRLREGNTHLDIASAVRGLATMGLNADLQIRTLRSSSIRCFQVADSPC